MRVAVRDTSQNQQPFQAPLLVSNRAFRFRESGPKEIGASRNRAQSLDDKWRERTINKNSLSPRIRFRLSVTASQIGSPL